MTMEEAIKIINCYDIGFYDLSGAKIPADKLADAFDMAIEALSAEVVHKPDYSYEADMVRRIKEALLAKSEQTIRHIENNTKESDLVYRPSADDTFCKSQLITCNRVKECNGVCPFEDALKHADQMQTMNEQHVIGHDRDWIIGCIQHDGFIHTHRFDKANQIILEAVQGEECDHCVYKWGMKGGDDE